MVRKKFQFNSRVGINNKFRGLLVMVAEVCSSFSPNSLVNLLWVIQLPCPVQSGRKIDIFIIIIIIIAVVVVVEWKFESVCRCSCNYNKSSLDPPISVSV